MEKVTPFFLSNPHLKIEIFENLVEGSNPSRKGWGCKNLLLPQKSKSTIHCFKNLQYLYQRTENNLRWSHVCVGVYDSEERNGKGIKSLN